MTLLYQKINEGLQGRNSHINTLEPAFIEAIKIIEKKGALLRTQEGACVRKDDYIAIIKPLLELEKLAAKGNSPWRVVIDIPSSKGNYIGYPSIQFCSAPPHYDRLIFSFKPHGVEVKFDNTAIETNPDLKTIQSQFSPDGFNNSLSSLRKFYNEAGVERIAILGSARVFPYQKPDEPLNSNNEWAQKYVSRVQTQLNHFLNAMEQSNTLFTTVNGGWAGTQEQSMGMPMISNLIGAVHEVESGGGFAPITVMPKVGAYDRVRTRAESINTNLDANPSTVNTYFEVDGVWGDDSKYLVGLSTALLVFEPFGFWTNIEIMNGLAQNKPVAIIVDPEKITPPGEYYTLFNHGEKFAIKEMLMPDGSKKEYRLYRKAADAADWFHECYKQNKAKPVLHAYSSHPKREKKPAPISLIEPIESPNANRTEIRC